MNNLSINSVGSMITYSKLMKDLGIIAISKEL